jgi:hypothetical protein
MESLLGRLFGSPSLVVSTFLVLNSLWSWWSFARGAASTTSVLLDRSHDQVGRGSFKVQATLRTAVAWSILYLVASFVTQLWAGSQYSPGQGGGLRELLQWSALFGLIAVGGCLYLVPSRGPKRGSALGTPTGSFRWIPARPGVGRGRLYREGRAKPGGLVGLPRHELHRRPRVRSADENQDSSVVEKAAPGLSGTRCLRPNPG